MTTQVLEVALKDVRPSKRNLRGDVGDVTDLAESIKAQGIIAPIVVVAEGQGYEVVAGNRRLEAAKLAKLTEVPVIVRTDLDEKGRLEIQLIENLQREDLTPLEEAEAYEQLLEVTGYSQRELSTRIGKSQAIISKRLSLKKLPETIQAALLKGKLNIGDAEEIARLDDGKDMQDVMSAMKSDPFLSVKSFVDRQEADRKRTAKVQEARAKAEAAGFLVVPSQDLEDGSIVPVEAQADEGYAGVGVKLADHKKLDCHAVIIEANGNTLSVCTNPEIHFGSVTPIDAKEPKGTKTAKDVVEEIADHIEPAVVEMSAEQKKAQRALDREAAEKRNLNAARKARETFISESLLQGRAPAKAEVTERVFWGFIERAGASETTTAVKWLGIEAEKPAEGWQASGLADQALREYASTNADNLMRVGLALALAVGENGVNSVGSETWDGDYDVRHFSFLEQRGYALSAIEAKRLGKKAPAKKATTAKKSTAK